jgi:hypothetical protein
MRKLASLGAVLLTLTSGAAFGQSLAIDHKDVGCLVAGQYPRLDACFTPVDALARARVYFRATGTPNWYYVDMKPEAPCHSGYLPRPKKSTGKIDYYVEAVDKSFVQSRTPEFSPEIVGNATECKKKAAPGVPNANVIVGAAPGAPIVPFGFAGAGIGTGLIAAGVIGGGAAIAGTAVALNKSDTTTTTVRVTTPPVTNPPVTNPPPTTPRSNQPPIGIFDINPKNGAPPLAVTLNSCRSSDPENDPLTYSFDFGDGFTDGGANCRSTHTYDQPAGSRFTTTSCVTDNIAPHAPVCQRFNVTLAGACANNTAPSVRINSPETGQTIDRSELPFTVRGSASDAENNLATISVDAVNSSGFTERIGETTRSPFAFSWDPCKFRGDAEAIGRQGFQISNEYTLVATATDTCNASSEFRTTVFVNCFGGSNPSFNGFSRVTWRSDLGLTSATGQVVVNGTNASFPSSGQSQAVAEVKRGAENRIEAQVVSSNGAAGTWRFELLTRESFVPGSLRVIAGEVTSVSENAITFRLSGKPGDRVVFAFRGK